MTVNVETLDKLKRKIAFSIPETEVAVEVDKRIRKLASRVKMDGFRPGKVPMSVVRQQYGYSVHYEVLDERIKSAFESSVRAAALRIAAAPEVKAVEGAGDGQMKFEATFEVFPEVPLPDLSRLEITRFTSQTDGAAVDRTIELLRKQRSTFNTCSSHTAASDDCRATVDFEGKVDGEVFSGGTAKDFVFTLGEGQMLSPFEDAVRGMKVGESKTFVLPFPKDYHGKEVAGKDADFLVTLKKLEARHLPTVDDAFAASVKATGGTLEGLRADIHKNIEREVRTRLFQRNRESVFTAFSDKVLIDLPQSAVDSEARNLAESAREQLKARGHKVDGMPLGEDLFRSQAEKRIKLSLVLGELVRQENLKPRPEQVTQYIEDLAASYEDPMEVVRWYGGDRSRMDEVHSQILDSNVIDHILAKAQVTDKALSFEELME